MLSHRFGLSIKTAGFPMDQVRIVKIDVINVFFSGDESGDYLLEKIRDSAGQKGTGISWGGGDSLSSFPI